MTPIDLATATAPMLIPLGAAVAIVQAPPTIPAGPAWAVAIALMGYVVVMVIREVGKIRRHEGERVGTRETDDYRIARADGRDFGTMLERLGNLAELNQRTQGAVAQDREDTREALRVLGVQSTEQTKVLENLVRITDATLAASTANSQMLQDLQAARRRR